jgi:hypothetical protein
MPITEMDDGCVDANNFIKSRSSCWRCPFGDCIYDLKSTEKSLILRAEVVFKVLSCYKRGMSVEKIVAKHKGITKAQVWDWLRNKKQVKDKLNKYAPSIDRCAVSV